MMNARDLFEELNYFIFLKIENDIINSPDNRREYQPYVEVCRAQKITEEMIPTVVLGMLLAESNRLQRSIWYRIKQWFK
jgi:hypothetical protein